MDEMIKNEFQFYTKLAKPLILNLPKSKDRILAAAWIKKFREESAGTEKLRTTYLKLLLFCLQRRKLTGIFADDPSFYEFLEELPEDVDLNDFARNLLEQESSERKALIKLEMMGDLANIPAYTTDCSPELTEYVAAQDIPNFGVHAYYAISKQPINKWQRAEKAILPKGTKSAIETSIEGRQSAVVSGCVCTPKGTSSAPEVEEGAAPDCLSPKTPEQTKKRRPGKLGISPPTQPIGEVKRTTEERLTPTWGTNLLDVHDTTDIGHIDEPSEEIQALEDQVAQAQAQEDEEAAAAAAEDEEAAPGDSETIVNDMLLTLSEYTQGKMKKTKRPPSRLAKLGDKSRIKAPKSIAQPKIPVKGMKTKAKEGPGLKPANLPAEFADWTEQDLQEAGLTWQDLMPVDESIDAELQRIEDAEMGSLSPGAIVTEDLGYTPYADYDLEAMIREAEADLAATVQETGVEADSSVVERLLEEMDNIQDEINLSTADEEARQGSPAISAGIPVTTPRRSTSPRRSRTPERSFDDDDDELLKRRASPLRPPRSEKKPTKKKSPKRDLSPETDKDLNISRVYEEVQRVVHEDDDSFLEHEREFDEQDEFERLERQFEQESPTRRSPDRRPSPGRGVTFSPGAEQRMRQRAFEQEQLLRTPEPQVDRVVEQFDLGGESPLIFPESPPPMSAQEELAIRTNLYNTYGWPGQAGFPTDHLADMSEESLGLLSPKVFQDSFISPGTVDAFLVRPGSPQAEAILVDAQYQIGRDVFQRVEETYVGRELEDMTPPDLSMASLRSSVSGREGYDDTMGSQADESLGLLSSFDMQQDQLVPGGPVDDAALFQSFQTTPRVARTPSSPPKAPPPSRQPSPLPIIPTLSVSIGTSPIPPPIPPPMPYFPGITAPLTPRPQRPIERPIWYKTPPPPTPPEPFGPPTRPYGFQSPLMDPFDEFNYQFEEDAFLDFEQPEEVEDLIPDSPYGVKQPGRVRPSPLPVTPKLPSRPIRPANLFGTQPRPPSPGSPGILAEFELLEKEFQADSPELATQQVPFPTAVDEAAKVRERAKQQEALLRGFPDSPILDRRKVISTPPFPPKYTPPKPPPKLWTTPEGVAGPSRRPTGLTPPVYDSDYSPPPTPPTSPKFPPARRIKKKGRYPPEQMPLPPQTSPYGPCVSKPEEQVASQVAPPSPILDRRKVISTPPMPPKYVPPVPPPVTYDTPEGVAGPSRRPTGLTPPIYDSDYSPPPSPVRTPRFPPARRIKKKGVYPPGTPPPRTPTDFRDVPSPYMEPAKRLPPYGTPGQRGQNIFARRLFETPGAPPRVPPPDSPVQYPDSPVTPKPHQFSAFVSPLEFESPPLDMASPLPPILQPGQLYFPSERVMPTQTPERLPSRDEIKRRQVVPDTLHFDTSQRTPFGTRPGGYVHRESISAFKQMEPIREYDTLYDWARETPLWHKYPAMADYKPAIKEPKYYEPSIRQFRSPIQQPTVRSPTYAELLQDMLDANIALSPSRYPPPRGTDRYADVLEASEAFKKGLGRYLHIPGAERRRPSGIRPPSGYRGIRPPSGPSRIRPPSGVSGIRPPSGLSGIRPPSGASGIRPPSGASGIRPPSGASGIRPPSGTSGIRPPSGPSGIRPPSGPSGIRTPAGYSGIRPPSTTPGHSGSGIKTPCPCTPQEPGRPPIQTVAAPSKPTSTRFVEDPGRPSQIFEKKPLKETKSSLLRKEALAKQKAAELEAQKKKEKAERAKLIKKKKQKMEKMKEIEARQRAEAEAAAAREMAIRETAGPEFIEELGEHEVDFPGYRPGVVISGRYRPVPRQSARGFQQMAIVEEESSPPCAPCGGAQRDFQATLQSLRLIDRPQPQFRTPQRQPQMGGAAGQAGLHPIELAVLEREREEAEYFERMRRQEEAAAQRPPAGTLDDVTPPRFESPPQVFDLDLETPPMFAESPPQLSPWQQAVLETTPEMLDEAFLESFESPPPLDSPSPRPHIPGERLPPGDTTAPQLSPWQRVAAQATPQNMLDEAFLESFESPPPLESQTPPAQVPVQRVRSPCVPCTSPGANLEAMASPIFQAVDSERRRPSPAASPVTPPLVPQRLREEIMSRHQVHPGLQRQPRRVARPGAFPPIREQQERLIPFLPSPPQQDPRIRRQRELAKLKRQKMPRPPDPELTRLEAQIYATTRDYELTPDHTPEGHILDTSPSRRLPPPMPFYQPPSPRTPPQIPAFGAAGRLYPPPHDDQFYVPPPGLRVHPDLQGIDFSWPMPSHIGPGIMEEMPDENLYFSPPQYPEHVAEYIRERERQAVEQWKPPRAVTFDHMPSPGELGLLTPPSGGIGPHRPTYTPEESLSLGLLDSSQLESVGHEMITTPPLGGLIESPLLDAMDQGMITTPPSGGGPTEQEVREFLQPVPYLEHPVAMEEMRYHVQRAPGRPGLKPRPMFFGGYGETPQRPIPRWYGLRRPTNVIQEVEEVPSPPTPGTPPPQFPEPPSTWSPTLDEFERMERQTEAEVQRRRQNLPRRRQRQQAFDELRRRNLLSEMLIEAERHQMEMARPPSPLLQKLRLPSPSRTPPIPGTLPPQFPEPPSTWSPTLDEFERMELQTEAEVQRRRQNLPRRRQRQQAFDELRRRNLLSEMLIEAERHQMEMARPPSPLLQKLRLPSPSRTPPGRPRPPIMAAFDSPPRRPFVRPELQVPQSPELLDSIQLEGGFAPSSETSSERFREQAGPCPSDFQSLMNKINIAARLAAQEPSTPPQLSPWQPALTEAARTPYNMLDEAFLESFESPPPLESPSSRPQIPGQQTECFPCTPPGGTLDAISPPMYESPPMFDQTPPQWHQLVAEATRTPQNMLDNAVLESFETPPPFITPPPPMSAQERAALHAQHDREIQEMFGASPSPPSPGPGPDFFVNVYAHHVDADFIRGYRPPCGVRDQIGSREVRVPLPRRTPGPELASIVEQRVEFRIPPPQVNVPRPISAPARIRQPPIRAGAAPAGSASAQRIAEARRHYQQVTRNRNAQTACPGTRGGRCPGAAAPAPAPAPRQPFGGLVPRQVQMRKTPERREGPK